MADVKIRPGRIKDRDELLEVWLSMMRLHETFPDLEFEMVDEAPDIWKKFFETCIRSPKRKVFVAEARGKLVGYVNGHIAKRPPIFKVKENLYVMTIVVHPDWRKKGIGKMLMDALNEWGKSKGISYICLNVAAANKAALKFYEKCGYVNYMHLLKKNL